jgi:hypothetical protein
MGKESGQHKQPRLRRECFCFSDFGHVFSCRRLACTISAARDMIPRKDNRNLCEVKDRCEGWEDGPRALVMCEPQGIRVLFIYDNRPECEEEHIHKIHVQALLCS